MGKEVEFNLWYIGSWSLPFRLLSRSFTLPIIIHFSEQVSCFHCVHVLLRSLSPDFHWKVSEQEQTPHLGMFTTNMLFITSSIRILSVTNPASKFLSLSISGTWFHVCLHATLVNKTLTTVATFECFYFIIRIHMTGKMWQFTELFAAYTIFTFSRTFFMYSLVMFLHARWRSKVFPQISNKVFLGEHVSCAWLVKR